MALYSWFLRTDNKPSIKADQVKKDIIKASKTVKCIKNYTMWPTATVKTNVDIPATSCEEKSVKPEKVILPNSVALTIIKNQLKPL